MILFSLAGFAAQSWAGLQSGVALGLLVGFVVAALIPAKTSCGVAPARDPTDVTRQP